MSKKFDVIGIGVSAVDILHIVEELPNDEGVQRSLADTIQGGGPIATAMVTLARLGARTAMVDVLGGDWRGDLILREFHHYGVSTEFIGIAEGHTSAIATILVRQGDGARSIIFAPGSVPELDTLPVVPEIVSSAKIVHLNGRHLKACLDACAIAKESDVKISFDGGAHRYRPELDELIALSDICIIARNFAEEFTEKSDIDKAGVKILANGPETAVITGGVDGSWVFTHGTSFHQQAFRAPEVVDTTGCGDCYHGAFLYGLVNGMNLRETARFAAAAAALNCRALGGRAALPTIDEAREFLTGR
ncbi:carbohydrate kinase family protein [candidate division KSB1 bacterium]